MEKINRILDANVNRVAEGIRVVEDITRFYFEDVKKTENLRILRHKLRKSLAKSDEKFIKSRDSLHDIGKDISAKSTLDKKTSLKQLVLANFKRVTEGLRAMEESLKVMGQYDDSKIMESLRYESYYLEKEVLSLFKTKLPDGLYCLTAENFSNGRSNIEVVKEMLEAGVKLVQYREKNKKMGEKLKDCIEIRRMTKEAGALFIVNDHIDIALLVDADGIHIGQDDIPLQAARKLLGDDKIIGLSTHLPEQVEQAIKDGADYVGVGPVFKTYTKVDVCDPVGFEYLEYVVKNTDIPFVAIGGIKEHNLDEVLKRGTKSVALVTEIVGADDIQGTIKRIEDKLKEYK